MSQKPLFLHPEFQERIWGGEHLHTQFGYDIPSEKTAEAWAISAHKNGPAHIINGEFKGMNLREVWEKHPHLFGKEETKEDFPLLVKILDANKNLSVQVHPDDRYARTVEGESYGKTECWYILDAKEGAEIIYGHHASSKAEFLEMVSSGKWDELLRHVKVKKGDFFFVPSGTIHAIGEGIVILETQQSSDITYRVYDFDRKDDAGNTRELHIESAAEVTNFPHRDAKQEQKQTKFDGGVLNRLIKEEYFTVYHLDLGGHVQTPVQADYVLVSVVEGDGELIIEDETFNLKKGDHFILPRDIDDYELQGQMECILSHE